MRYLYSHEDAHETKKRTPATTDTRPQTQRDTGSYASTSSRTHTHTTQSTQTTTYSLTAVYAQTHNGDSSGVISGLRYYSPELGRAISRPHSTEMDYSESYADVLFTSADDLAKGRVPLLSEEELGYWACFPDDGKMLDPKAKPIPKDKRSAVNPGNCPGFMDCTRKHENVHERDLGSCCEKAQEAWNNASGTATEVNRRRMDIKRKWRNWYGRAGAQSECNAYKVSVDCYRAYYEKYDCDECYKPGADPKGEENWRDCCDRSVPAVDEAENRRRKFCSRAKRVFPKAGKCPSF